MLTPLYNKKPDRIFAFGCSLTSYMWSMWPEIIHYATGIPTYNYGRIACSNHYILNQIVLANKLHKFSNNDLVIIAWTEPNRHENLHNNGGKTYLQWDRDYSVEKHEYITGKIINQLNIAVTAMSYLDNTGAQIHHSSNSHFRVPAVTCPPERPTLEKVYESEFERFLPAIRNTILVDLEATEKKFKSIFNEKFLDLHPFPSESLRWLREVFDYDFSTVESQIHEHDQEIINSIKTVVLDPSYSPGPEFPGIDHKKLPDSVFLCPKIDGNNNDISWHKIFRNGGFF